MVYSTLHLNVAWSTLSTFLLKETKLSCSLRRSWYDSVLLTKMDQLSNSLFWNEFNLGLLRLCWKLLIDTNGISNAYSNHWTREVFIIFDTKQINSNVYEEKNPRHSHHYIFVKFMLYIGFVFTVVSIYLFYIYLIV